MTGRPSDLWDAMIAAGWKRRRAREAAERLAAPHASVIDWHAVEAAARERYRQMRERRAQIRERQTKLCEQKETLPNDVTSPGMSQDQTTIDPEPFSVENLIERIRAVLDQPWEGTKVRHTNDRALYVLMFRAIELLELRTRGSVGNPFGRPDVAYASRILGDAMRADPGFAIAWHANLAMVYKDAGGNDAVAQRAATAFMRSVFGVDQDDSYRGGAG